MIVEPFKTSPINPRIALVNDEGIYVDETGATFSDNSGYKFRLGQIVCFIFWDTAISLTQRGIGEYVRWNTKEIKWRRNKHPDEEYWKPRPLDAGIIQFPTSINFSIDRALKELVEFRDWLVDEGAKPHCTFGSTSISLLRAKLTGKLITGLGACPPIEFTRGGRVLLGLKGSGKYEGQIKNWDLPAAYASTLGNINFGGSWTVRPFNAAIKSYNNGSPVYCHARVSIPTLSYGPLPGTIRRAANPLESAILNKYGYTTNGEMEGIWTLNELFAAEEVGCKFTPITCWAQMTGEQPFLPWWNAILRGRELRGQIARSLAKRTGNALWGTCCSDGSARIKKVIVSYENGKKKTRKIDFRHNGQKPGHDLAEAVSSAVRAKLYQHIIAADSHLLSAHTDGVWVQGEYEIPDGWRVKQEARRIDLIDPQILRYYTDSQTSHVVMSGIPYKLAPEKFKERWARCEYALANTGNLPNVQQRSRNPRRILRVSPTDNLS